MAPRFPCAKAVDVAEKNRPKRKMTQMDLVLRFKGHLRNSANELTYKESKNKRNNKNQSPKESRRKYIRGPILAFLFECRPGEILYLLVKARLLLSNDAAATCSIFAGPEGQVTVGPGEEVFLFVGLKLPSFQGWTAPEMVAAAYRGEIDAFGE
jgi:hypothetical protein